MATRIYRPNKKLVVHIRILTTPDIPVSQMVEAMSALFVRANISVELKSTEKLNLSQDDLEFLNAIDVGNCDATPSDDQVQLSQFRDGVGANETVIYFCESVKASDGIKGGCASHPQGVPMVVISSRSSFIYTMAHEVGHLLGLGHCNDRYRHRLMNSSGPLLPPPPVKITVSEIRKMRQSPYLI